MSSLKAFRSSRLGTLLIQSVLLGVGRISGKLLSFVGFTLIARALGPTLYGPFAFAISVASLLVFLPNMGVDPYYSREVALGRKCRRGLLTRILTLKLAGGALFLVLYPLIMWFSSGNNTSVQTVVFLDVAFVLLCFTETWRSVLITAGRAGLSGFLELLQSAFFLLLVGLLVMNHPAPESAAMAFSIAQIAGVAIGAVLVWRLLAHSPANPSNTTYRSLLSSTLPLMAIWLFSDLYLRIDTAMLYLFRGEAETGYYAASYRLVEGVCSITLVLCAIVLPRMAKEWGNGVNHWTREWRQSSVGLLCVLILPTLAFWTWPEWTIQRIYGAQFLPSATSLKVLGPASALLCLGYLQGSALTSIGLERSQLTITAVGLLTNVGLNLWLIPSLGGVGAAWATLGSALVYFVLAQFSLKRAIRANQGLRTTTPFDKQAPETPALKCTILISSAAIGGAERFLVELAIAMSRTTARATLVNLKSAVAYRADLARNGVPVYSGLAEHRLSLMGPIRLFLLLCKLRPDVLFINTNRQAMWLGIVVGRVCRIPLILIHTHDHLPEHVRDLRAAERWTDGVIAASQSHCTTLCQNHGLDPRRVKAVYPGIDLSRTRHRGSRPTPMSNNFPVVGILAALRPEKDHKTFLQAAAIARQQIPNLRARIIGDGPIRPDLESLARELAINDCTEFVGWQTVNDILFSGIDVLVLSSTSETFPAVILESFGAGVPVIATDVGSVAEMLSFPVSGLLVQPRDPRALSDAVVRLLQDPQHAQELSENALTKAEFYSADRFCADTLAVFQEMKSEKIDGFKSKHIHSEELVG